MGSYTTVLGLFKPVLDDTVAVAVPEFANNGDRLETAIIGRAKTSATYREVFKTGVLTVANNILPPGIRVGNTTTLSECHVRVGTPPLGTNLIVTVSRAGTPLVTATVPAGSFSVDVTGLTVGLVVGDILQFNVTQIGSSQAGSDLAVALLGV